MPNLIVDTAQWSWPSPATLLPTSKQAGRVFALESGDSRKLVEDSTTLYAVASPIPLRNRLQSARATAMCSDFWPVRL